MCSNHTAPTNFCEAPEDVMLARIFQRTKSATQSGLARTNKWVLQFEPEKA